MRNLLSRYSNLSHKQKSIVWAVLFSILFVPGVGLVWWIPFSLLVGVQAYHSFKKRNNNLVGGVSTELLMIGVAFVVGAIPVVMANPSFFEIPAEEVSMVESQPEREVQKIELLEIEAEVVEEVPVEIVEDTVKEPEIIKEPVKPVAPVKSEPVQPQPVVAPVVPEPTRVVVEPIPVTPPAPTPVPVAAPAPVQNEVSTSPSGGYIDGTCAYLRTLGLGNFTPGDPNYLPRRDRDGDGVACEM